MTHPKLLSRAAAACLAAALTTSLPACTKQNACEDVFCAPCQFTDDVVLAFDLDSLRGGFRRAEFSGAYAVRYALPGFGTPLDTLREGRVYSGQRFSFYGRPTELFFLPWPTVTQAYSVAALNAHNYRFVLPAATRTYNISSVDVASEAGDGKSCCSCGSNVRRRFVLNGTAVVADGNGPPDVYAWLRR